MITADAASPKPRPGVRLGLSGLATADHARVRWLSAGSASPTIEEPAVSEVPAPDTGRPRRFVLPSDDDQQTGAPSIAIPPRAYLRAMWQILVSTLLHPFSTTVIDLDSGKVIND
jgi:hypothetical protein